MAPPRGAHTTGLNAARRRPPDTPPMHGRGAHPPRNRHERRTAPPMRAAPHRAANARRSAARSAAGV